MAFNRFEQSLVDQYTNTQFPDLPPEPEQPMQPPGTQPGDVLVAEAGSRGLPESAYTGQTQAEMKPFDPTIRQRMADFLQAGLEGIGVDRYTARKNAQTIMGGESSNLPIGIGLADLVPFLGTALQTQEAVRMGEEAATSVQQGRYGTAALQTAGAGLGLIPGVAGTIKGAKTVAPMIPKNVPVGASTDVVGGGTQAMLQAGKATAPVSDIGFYSAVEDAALNIQRKSGSGQAMLNDITKAANVKADEIKWIGLDDFLKGKKNVTREEVQNFIAQNKVDVQEVELNNTASDAMRAAKEKVDTERVTLGLLLPQGISRLDEANLTSFWAAEAAKGDKTSLAKIQGLKLDANTMQAVMDYGNAVNKYTDAYQAAKGSSKPKFGTWTLPGGENYREILLTMPAKERLVETQIPAAKQKPTVFAASNGKFELLDEMGETFATYNTKAEAEQAATDWAAPFTKKETVKDKEYQSSHWDQPNVLAHIRVNDRVDADGKKMLLVEEVQSDWHQAGRDSGYATKLMTDEERKRFDEFVALDRERPLTAEERLEYQPLADKRVKEMTLQREGVPDAPMKDTWYQLALKRVLKYAADNGYERVGLTTGSRQAERYDLSKQIDSIEFNKMPDGNIFWTAYKDGKRAVGNDSTPSELESQVGKELAKKIIEHEGPGKLSGIDLQVGGEGMKKYYDEVYPQFLAKYGKKWGAKVGETTIEVGGGKPTQYADFDAWKKAKDGKSEPIRYVDITPQMRESVGKGQPLFTATGLGTGTAATMQDKEQK